MATVSFFARGDCSTAKTTDPVSVCIFRGTHLRTPSEYRKAEDLRAGDMVSAWDSGPQEILWIGSTRVAADGKFMPVRIAASALGGDTAYCGLATRPSQKAYEAELLVRSVA